MTDGTTGEMSTGESDLDADISYERPVDEPPSIAVAVALARHRGEAVTNTKTRLYDHVDPDALDTLFEETVTGGPRVKGTVTFGVDGCTVTVEPDMVRVSRDA